MAGRIVGRLLTPGTFDKWQKQHENEHQTVSWLCCDLATAIAITRPVADLGGHVNPPLILNSVLRVSLPSVILYKHLLNSHAYVVVNPLLIFLDPPLQAI